MDGMESLRNFGQAKDTTLIIMLCVLERRCWCRLVEKMSLVDGIKLLGIVEKPITLA
jgi:hypothetical protein